MPRVVMVVNSNFLHDSRVQKEALALSKSGYQVTVFSLTLSGPREQFFKDIRLLNPTTGRLAWLPYKLQHIKALWQVIRALLREKSAVWHGHDLEALPYVFIASKLRGGKPVYDAHEFWQGYDWPGSSGRWELLRRLVWKGWLYLEKKLAKRCHLVITVNQSIAQKMAESLGIEPPLVVRNCADPPDQGDGDAAGLRKRLGLAWGETLVVYSGKLQKGRGLENLLKAWAALPGRAQLAFVGDGPLESDLRAFSSRAGYHNVHFLPPVKAWELPGFIHGASLGVVLTEACDRNHYFSLPNKIFEYIAAGVPVLASDLPEIRHLVEGNQIGVITDSRDPGEIRAALLGLLGEEKKLDALRQNVLAVQKGLTWQEEVRRLTHGYSKLTGGVQE